MRLIAIRALAATARWRRHLRQRATQMSMRALHPGVDWAGPGTLARHARISLVGRADLRIAPGVDLAEAARLFVRDGRLEIGAGTFIGIGAVIAAQDHIEIGQGVLIAEYVTIRDQDHAPAGGFTTAPIRIGDGAWLGAKVTVTKGARIGARAVIGANSVVTGEIPADCVAVGAPARVIGPRRTSPALREVAS